MTTAFVLGNGLSRQSISLQSLKDIGCVYGCNALYRDFVPNVLVATDRPIAEEIQRSGYSAQHRFHTRRPLEDLGALPVPKPYFGYSSGPIAVSLAATDGHRRVYLLGFDMGPTLDKKFNNIYANTEFYKTGDSAPTFTGNWVRQMTQVMRDFPLTRFFRICGSTTAQIPELQQLPNLEHQDLQLFVNRLNTTKDL